MANLTPNLTTASRTTNTLSFAGGIARISMDGTTGFEAAQVGAGVRKELPPMDERVHVIFEVQNDANDWDPIGSATLQTTEQTKLIELPAGDIRARLKGGNANTDLTVNVS